MLQDMVIRNGDIGRIPDALESVEIPVTGCQWPVRVDAWIALLLAVEEGHKEMVQFLITKAPYAEERRSIAMSSAIRSGQLAIVKLLVAAGLDVDHMAEDGTPALTLAVQSNHLNLVRFLLEKGADMTQQDGTGNTPLMVAASIGNMEMVEILMGKGAEEGNDAVTIAKQKGHMGVVKALERALKSRSQSDLVRPHSIGFECFFGHAW